MNFHISKIFIHLDVYLNPIHWSAPSWFVSSIGRALHRYRRGHGFKSLTGLNFFQVLFTTTRFSSVLSCEDLLISNIAYVPLRSKTVNTGERCFVAWCLIAFSLFFWILHFAIKFLIKRPWFRCSAYLKWDKLFNKMLSKKFFILACYLRFLHS